MKKNNKNNGEKEGRKEERKGKSERRNSLDQMKMKRIKMEFDLLLAVWN